MAIETREDFIKRTSYIEKSIKNIKTIVSSANKYQIQDFEFDSLESNISEIENKIYRISTLVKELD
ncbi:MAG: hypothetical protein ACK5NF_06410 [Bacilli bacterium]